ncbi:MAG: polyphosphate polymerase domain-containing protein [Nannocystaceae bacterium]
MREVTRTLIERREFKYLIPAPLVEPLRGAIRPYCRLDPFAERIGRRRYLIENLYFDTEDLSLYRSAVTGGGERLKLRVRGYPESSGGRVFLEVKRRINDVILKRRGQVSSLRWTHLVADPEAPIPDEVVGEDRDAVEHFVTLARALRVRPSTLVRYEREPYVSRKDEYVRVTFDSEIRAQRVEDLSLEPCYQGWRRLDRSIVCELKFNRAMPPWLVDLVARFGLQRRPYSKYRSSIRAFSERPWVQDPDGP